MNASGLQAVRSGVALILLIALALAGCGDRGGSATEKGAAAGPQSKVFHFYRREAYKTLDPAKQFDVSSGELIANLYDSLLEYEYLKRPYELKPNLLTKMPELSSDGLTYTFELRDDVRFNDDPCFPGGKGRPVTADDAIYSLQRFADANVNVLSFSLLQGVIEGIDAFREQTAKLGKATDYAKLRISGVAKVDARHFTIKLTRPSPIALYPLASPMLSVVPREAVERYGRDFENHPVGSGPFIAKKLDRRGTVILHKNPRYHGVYPTTGRASDEQRGLLADAGKRLPLIDAAELPLIEEPQPAMLRFLSGQLDWIAMDRDSFTKIAFKDAKGFHLKPEYAGKFQLYAVPDLRSEYFAFNMKDKLVGKNKALREAIAHAFNSAAFLDQMLNGRGEVLTSIVPIEIAGSQRDVPSQGFKYDPELAKRKLAEAGYPGGKGLPPIIMDERASTTSVRQQFEFMRAELERVGITVQANYQTFSAWLKRIESGNFQMTEQGWGADYPDAENFYQLLYSKNKTPGPNVSSYENAEYDALYEQIRSMPNGPERFALFARMNEMIRRDVPIIVTMNFARVGLYQNWVKNFERNVLMDIPLKYLDVDTAAKAKGRR
jgi:oligopeptide transport system substrate-binding protein